MALNARPAILASRLLPLALAATGGAALLPMTETPGSSPFHGPLRVCAANPRYFADDLGKPIFLTGSHTWSNFQDSRLFPGASTFDYPAYLAFLKARGHNLVRLWRWELPAWAGDDLDPDRTNVSSPHPWLRTGPGLAADGKPKFDLSRFDPAYFARLRERVLAARKEGMYASVMLFEGWAMQFVKGAWQQHPYYPTNHVGELPGPPPGNPESKEVGTGVGIYEDRYPAVTAAQEAYVRKVVETLGDLDNVMYEISNENHGPSTEWQYRMIRFIKATEAKGRDGRPFVRHPVGMTFQYAGESNAPLFAGPADWIGPGSYWPEDGMKPPALDAAKENYRDDPPVNDGRKVTLLDTDHLWGVGGNPDWVWKAFLRGHNILLMDTVPKLTGFPTKGSPDLEPVRRAMGDVRAWSLRLDLARMTPRGELCSTGYLLADPGREYLAYRPAPPKPDATKGLAEAKPGTILLDLAPGRYAASWYDPATRRTIAAPPVRGGVRGGLAGGVLFTPPVPGPAALHLKATS